MASRPAQAGSSWTTVVEVELVELLVDDDVDDDVDELVLELVVVAPGMAQPSSCMRGRITGRAPGLVM